MTNLHAKSTALEVIQTLQVDLTGKVVLITGGTAGAKEKRENIQENHEIYRSTSLFRHRT